MCGLVGLVTALVSVLCIRVLFLHVVCTWCVYAFCTRAFTCIENVFVCQVMCLRVLFVCVVCKLCWCHGSFMYVVWTCVSFVLCMCCVYQIFLFFYM